MRVLVIEDEHRIANSIKKGLEQESYAADVAYLSRTAAHRLTPKHPETLRSDSL